MKNSRPSPEERILLACTRQEFLEEYKKTVTDICKSYHINWKQVYSVARLHAVAPLVYSNLKKCINNIESEFPKEIIEKFNTFYLQNVLFKKVKAANITELLSFFNSRNVDVMLIKGSSLDVLVYESGWNTWSQDVDIIIKKRREEITTKENSEYRSLFKKIGYMENEYFEHHDLNVDGVLPIDFEEIWERAIRIDYMGKYAYVLSPEDMLIFACISSYRKRYFRLKTLLDIAEIVNKYSDIDWGKVTLRARKYCCGSIVYTALITTKMTLGCKFPLNVLSELNVGLVRRKVISYISESRLFCSTSSLYSGISFFGTKMNLSLILPYASISWYQVWGNMKVVYERKMRWFKSSSKRKRLKLSKSFFS